MMWDVTDSQFVFSAHTPDSAEILACVSPEQGQINPLVVVDVVVVRHHLRLSHDDDGQITMINQI